MSVTRDNESDSQCLCFETSGLGDHGMVGLQAGTYFSSLDTDSLHVILNEKLSCVTLEWTTGQNIPSGFSFIPIQSPDAF